MDRIELQRLADTVRTYISQHLSREVLIFAFFVVISAGFWLLLTLNDTYRSELHFRLRLTDVPEGVVVTTDLPEELHVSVQDRGMTLWLYHLPDRLPAINVSFSQYDAGTTSARVIVPMADVSKAVQQSLEATTRITAIRPDTLEYYYSRGEKKRVAVLLQGHVEAAPLYYLAQVTCEPDSVTIWANKSTLDSLHSVSTTAVVHNGLTATTAWDVPLAPLRGVKMEPGVVHITATVDVYTEKSVEVPIIGINFPSGHVLRTFPSTATVTFRVGALNYKNTTADDFALTATYEELLLRPDSTFRLRLRSLPEGVSQVHIQPETVQFMIEQTSN